MGECFYYNPFKEQNWQNTCVVVSHVLQSQKDLDCGHTIHFVKLCETTLNLDQQSLIEKNSLKSKVIHSKGVNNWMERESRWIEKKWIVIAHWGLIWQKKVTSHETVYKALELLN